MLLKTPGLLWLLRSITGGDLSAIILLQKYLESVFLMPHAKSIIYPSGIDWSYHQTSDSNRAKSLTVQMHPATTLKFQPVEAKENEPKIEQELDGSKFTPELEQEFQQDYKQDLLRNPELEQFMRS